MLRRAFLLTPALAGQQRQGWELVFFRVFERVEVYLDGPKGMLIPGPCNGATWCVERGQGQLPLAQWVRPDVKIVRLYARVTSRRGFPQCTMETRHNGILLQRWAFTNDEYHEIVRP